MPSKNACCVLIENKQGKVLAVSRGTDLTNWGLPGGKAEPREEPIQTAVRELFEETGIRIEANALMLIYENTVVEFTVKTFYNYEYFTETELVSSHEGTAKWVYPEELIKPTCTFAEYNRAVLEKAGLL